MTPLVSVITPTWQRHDLLLGRCIPSVQVQTCNDLEHIVVSDGPDPELVRLLAERYPPWRHPPVRFAELPSHIGSWGGPGRALGAALAQGTYIAYLDDDDAYRPVHVATLATALELHPEVGFVHSAMVAHLPSGARLKYSGPPGVMLGTPMIMHRRELLDIATWPSGLHEDTALVQAWMDAGVKHGAVTMTTVDVFPGPATTATIADDPGIGALNWE